MSARLPRTLAVLLALYAASSLTHFAHNAAYLADYPNLPAWLTRADVYLAFLAETLVGLSGLTLLVRGEVRVGLLILALYALLGFDGLAHYQRAPFAAHTPLMNFTILTEVAAAALLIIYLGVLARAGRRA